MVSLIYVMMSNREKSYEDMLKEQRAREPILPDLTKKGKLDKDKKKKEKKQEKKQAKSKESTKSSDEGNGLGPHVEFEPDPEILATPTVRAAEQLDVWFGARTFIRDLESLKK